MDYIEFVNELQSRKFKYQINEFNPQIYKVCRLWCDENDISTWDVVRFDQWGNFTVNHKPVNLYDWFAGF